MLEMMKKDYYISEVYLLTLLIFIPFLYVFNISVFAIVWMMTIGMILNLFYYDHHNHANRFIISLPMNCTKIVLSRYLFIIIFIGISIPYIWGFDYLMHAYLFPFISNWFPIPDNPELTFYLLAFALVFSMITMAVSLPIYYFFQSIIKSIIAHVVFAMLTLIAFILVLNIDLIPEKFVLTFVDILDFQPVVFVIVSVTVCLVISFLLSKRFFATRDID